MKFSPLARSISLGTLAVALSIPMAAQAAFIEDSKASLELRNFYMNRDFRSEGAPQSKAEEWAQGFILRYESGFTEGTVGVGVDAIGSLGLKLDSGRGTAGTGLLLQDKETKKAQDSYSKLAAAAKFKVSDSVLKVGNVMPKLPVISSSDSRLVPQSFKGGTLNIQEIEGLSVNLGRLDRVNNRASQDHEALKVNKMYSHSAKYKDKNAAQKKDDSNAFDFASLSYKWGETGLTTGYHYGKLDGFYKQHIVNGVYVLPIADGQSLKADLRYARTSEDGKSGIDNRAISGMLTYSLGYNSFGLGYQKMSGDTGYAYLAETDPFLTNYIQVRDFAAQDEKSWQARYDYNFAGLGVPGLNFMTRYVRGSNIHMGYTGNVKNSTGKEWERDTDIAYVVQDGPLKNLGVRWRNSTVRSDISVGKVDENRLIVSYTIPLL
ncbi:MAG TPA: OprD family porin [Thiopseudomonas sp.]|nr:OprD family porin [Thiopseudomonas sp.]